MASGTDPELIRKGRLKFGRADAMRFVREGLEQATHEAVAAYHASRFPPGVEVVDLTVGIGGDLIALAARGPARGYELDPERAALARHNLGVHGRAAEVAERDCLEDAPWGPYWFADPARRRDGRRVRGLAQYAPDPRDIVSRAEGTRLGLLKLSPGLADRELLELGADVRFVAYGGECREALVGVGSEARAGVRAVRLPDGLEAERGEETQGVASLGEWLYDADPALTRAGAVATVAGPLGLWPVSDDRAYRSGAFVKSPWLRPYRVVAEVKADRKALQAELRRGGGAGGGGEAGGGRGGRPGVDAVGEGGRTLGVVAVRVAHRTVVAVRIGRPGRRAEASAGRHQRGHGLAVGGVIRLLTASSVADCVETRMNGRILSSLSVLVLATVAQADVLLNVNMVKGFVTVKVNGETVGRYGKARTLDPVKGAIATVNVSRYVKRGRNEMSVHWSGGTPTGEVRISEKLPTGYRKVGAVTLNAVTRGASGTQRVTFNVGGTTGPQAGKVNRPRAGSGTRQVLLGANLVRGSVTAFLNGTRVGTYQQGVVPIDVSDYARRGTNRLRLTWTGGRPLGSFRVSCAIRKDQFRTVKQYDLSVFTKANSSATMTFRLP